MALQHSSYQILELNKTQVLKVRHAVRHDLVCVGVLALNHTMTFNPHERHEDLWHLGKKYDAFSYWCLKGFDAELIPILCQQNLFQHIILNVVGASPSHTEHIKKNV